MKTYTITAITKANRTEYFHAVTVEAESVKEAKEKASAIIRATLDRHAFRIANATASASIEHAQWIASRFNTTVDAVMQAASRPEGVDAYDFKPATVEAEPEPAPTEATKNAAHWADLAEQAAQQVAEAATICDADAYDNRAAMYAAAAAAQQRPAASSTRRPRHEDPAPHPDQ